jgi:hypothetical protein
LTCTNCRKELPEYARFCDGCGMQVVAPREAAAEPSPMTDTVPLPVLTLADVEPAPAPPPPPDTEPPAAAEPPPPPAYTPSPALPLVPLTPPPPVGEDARAVPPPSWMPPPPQNPPPGYGGYAPPSSSGQYNAPQGYRQPPPASGGAPVLTLAQSIGFHLVMWLPLVNLVMLCIWAFGSHDHPSRQNLARGGLITMAISVALWLLIGIFVVILVGMLGYANFPFQPGYWMY